MNNALKVFNDAETLSRAAAECFVQLADAAVEQRGACHVAFAGGNTPRRLYEILATDRYGERVPWQALHVYFGDERMVSHDHPDSNYHMACEALLDHVPIPREQIHPVNTALAPEAAARDYAALLRKSVPADAMAMPQFDLVLLGMGDDGHTASLFPDTPILAEREAPVAAVYVPKFGAWRVSMTLPVINRARNILLLVTGAAKAAVLAKIFGTAGSAHSYPVQMIAPQGEQMWYLDAAAAAQLPDGATQ